MLGMKGGTFKYYRSKQGKTQRCVEGTVGFSSLTIQ